MEAKAATNMAASSTLRGTLRGARVLGSRAWHPWCGHKPAHTRGGMGQLAPTPAHMPCAPAPLPGPRPPPNARKHRDRHLLGNEVLGQRGRDGEAAQQQHGDLHGAGVRGPAECVCVCVEGWSVCACVHVGACESVGVQQNSRRQRTGLHVQEGPHLGEHGVEDGCGCVGRAHALAVAIHHHAEQHHQHGHLR